MITGIVIGSGIFFKADDILRYANGNVFLGVIIFSVAAIAVVFGALTISQLAIRTDKPGGLVSYAEDFVGTGASSPALTDEVFASLPVVKAVVEAVVVSDFSAFSLSFFAQAQKAERISVSAERIQIVFFI